MIVYKAMFRPVGNSTLPEGVKWEWHEMPDGPMNPYGVIKTKEPISHADCVHFALERIEIPD